jgi:methyltransferase family protein
MLSRLPEKVDKLGLHDRVTMEQRSFLSMENVQDAPFDAVFSDLGGLNCVPDLSPVIRQLPKILKAGGIVTWVLMPHVCLWEMAEVFRGNFSLAFRRFARGSVRANLEGLNFDVYYFSPRQVIQWFGSDFEFLALEGLSVLTPTAESKNFAKWHPRLYRALSWFDDKLSPHGPWVGWGDFYILTMRFKPNVVTTSVVLPGD